ncbi:unnamed protein product [Rotaria magnacalcarata]|uniref:Uncharacterized protein n=1 Tax=Rotaria magnacalcarata TaxID=392030 RepID=A0A814Y9E0_9BILA|nr:unnamed protein product [Rotaria magnacalcarata]
MVSGVDNVYVYKEELTQFFEQYLRNVGTFPQDQYPEVFRVLLQKFQLNERSRIDFDEFYTIVLDDLDVLESLSRFTVHPDECVVSSRQTPEPNVAQRCCRRLPFKCKSYRQQRNKCTKEYISNNLSRIIIWILYIRINLALIT